MRRSLLFILQLLTISCIITSCEKEEGEGGNATIFGIVYKVIDDGKIIQQADGSYTFDKDTIIAKDEDVYIIYGEHDFGYDDKTSTAFDGTYCFKHLYAGKYTLYSLSDYASVDKQATLVNIDLTEGSTLCPPDIYIYDGKNVGKCGIVGTVEALYKESDWIPGFSLRVYAQKVGSLDVSDTRADENGVYAFPKLDPYSSYTIYIETEPEKNEGIVPEAIVVTTGAAGTIVKAETTIYAYIN